VTLGWQNAPTNDMSSDTLRSTLLQYAGDDNVKQAVT